MATSILQTAFMVPGEPKGKARHRSAPLMRQGRPVLKNGRPIVIQHSDAKTVMYENLVAHLAQEAMNGRPPLEGPLLMEIAIHLSIPQSWSNKKKLAAVNGNVMPTTKPDYSNVVKAIEDGMNHIVFRDDSQICEARVSKRYAQIPRVEVSVSLLNAKGAR
jgi:Holliday junction resolvase RusA-like endonuclease